MESEPIRSLRNDRQAAAAQDSLHSALSEATRRGWYGEIRITVRVADGTIQHIRGAVERIERPA